MRAKYHVAGIIAALAYILLFAAGLVIDSSPYRQQVNTVGGINLYALVVVALTYTPTNVAFLAMLAGLIAGCASMITYQRIEEMGLKVNSKNDPLIQQSLMYRTESPVASMFRALVVYFGFMAGILITSIEPFTVTTPEQYVRLAAAVSFFAFTVGYDPTKLAGLLKLPIQKGKGS